MRLLSMIFLTLAFAVPSALAYQTFIEYRIRGDEIVSVEIAPQELEDPATVLLTIASDGAAPVTVAIESDLGLDQCFADLRDAAGNELAYAEIVVHTNAATMNGVAVTTCAVTQGLH